MIPHKDFVCISVTKYGKRVTFVNADYNQLKL